MLKSNKLCSVCSEIKKDYHLVDRIYNTRFFLKNAGISLKELYENETKRGKHFSYESLLNHVKKHQSMNEDTYNEHHMRKIVKQAEKAIVKRSVDAMPVFDTVIGIGMEGLESGELKVSTKDVLTAAKYKKDIQLKEVDQEIAVKNMVLHFASGAADLEESRKYDRKLVSNDDPQSFNPSSISEAVEVKGDTDVNRGLTRGENETDLHPPTEPTADSEGRRERSRAFFERVIGDAASPGTD